MIPQNHRGARQAAIACGRSADIDYLSWIDEYEPAECDLRAQRELSRTFLYRPLFSIVIPVFKVRDSFLDACINSVLGQTYDNWELCLTHAAGQDDSNLARLRSLSLTNSNIRLVELPENGGISVNTNAALDLATGDFVAFLDHDDTLAPFALFEAAAALQAKAEADVLYSDHDYLDPEHSLRQLPLFKPDWSPEIMLSANYITHLTIIRKSVLQTVGYFNPDMDGAQDWDLFLRAIEQTDRVVHIPKVLYHWRMHPESTAHNSSAKSYVTSAQLRCLQRHVAARNLCAVPEVMPNGLIHMRPLRTPDTLVSIIIPTRDRLDLLTRCISTLTEMTAYPRFEILIVDTGSAGAETKDYFKTVSADSRIRVIWYPGQFNYSAANNMAAREAQGDLLLFLNNDVEFIKPDWLTELVMWAQDPCIGIVGGKLLRPDASIQHAGVVIGMNGFADHPFADEPALTFGLAGSTGWYRNFLAVTGACMLMRRDVFQQLGGFDEKFLLCGSDVEICLRARARGYRVVYNPFAELVHHEQQTRGTAVPDSDYLESLKHYGKWLLKPDPYWNPNLSFWSRKPSTGPAGSRLALSSVLVALRASKRKRAMHP